MSYSATVYNVMIASPSDVKRERGIVRDTIHEWNTVHSEEKRTILMPIAWETHSSPAMGDRPQQIINKQILENADLLVAVFWTRVGSPTGKSTSGTIEEIEGHLASGKPAMLYFSNAPVHPSSVDEEQYAALSDFRTQCEDKGLIETYDSITEFQAKLGRQLALTVIRHFSVGPSDVSSLTSGVEVSPVMPLSNEAQQLLLAGSEDRNGYIVKQRSLGGISIYSNSKQFNKQGEPRSEALWEDALNELSEYDLVREEGYKGEVFKLTTSGYKLADKLRP